ncbi:MAG: UDP-N-acetylmuramoyl-tripeptide--D-alanyl-D-alanine ligase [Fusobacteriaceae bacterium]|nr:UDP-N-acetylmuramoyl-tripeptide--D-alanyl-D-alanine ligase [Fusobacteriaceae bacterium]
MKLLEELLKNMRIGVPSALRVAKVVMDSRKIEQDALFLAINNGNNYVKEALQKGASLVVCDRNQGFTDPRVYECPDTVAFMQELAREYRKAIGLNVVAITGSNGKTTTKDILYGILSTKYKVKKTEGNHNNAIGLPYTLLQLAEDDEIVVLEMGMSAPGEIDALCGVALPDCGIITNIGDSHLEFLKTRENVFRAKKEMTNYVGPGDLYICGDDMFLATLDGIKTGFSETNDVVIKEYAEGDEGVEFSLSQKGRETKYRLPLNGRHNALNAALAVTVAKRFKITRKQIEKALKELSITPMRFEKIEIDGVRYINDAYNASPVSMRCALETFRGIYADCHKIAVLGDMLELGPNEVNFHKDLLREGVGQGIDEFFLFGPRMRKALDLLEESDREGIRYFSSKDDIRKAIAKKKAATPRLAVLVKGSRGMAMEEILDR